MAVQDKYVDSKVVSGLTTGALQGQGAKTVTVAATFEVAAADDDLSVYRVFPNIPASAVFTSISIGSDALTGSTGWDVGLYKPGIGGAVISDNVLASGIDLAAGYALAPGTLKSGLAAVDLADRLKMLWELAGQTILNKDQNYDVCLTADTVGSGAGTVTVIGTYTID